MPKIKRSVIINIAFIIIVTNAVYAQDSKVGWTSILEKHSSSLRFKKESAVILEDVRYSEFAKDENKDLYLHTYRRCLVELKDDKGVESFNKIYVYVAQNAKVIELKARTLQPNGKQVDLPENKILDEEEEGKHYKKFAMEGIEKGSLVEYYVHLKKPINTFGTEIFYSSKVPLEKAVFTLSVPSYLVFQVKGYNGFTVGKDTVLNDNRIIAATAENLEGFDEEKYSSFTPYQPNVQFKLSYNLDKDRTVKLYTWNDLAKNVYNNYNVFTEKEQKVLTNVLKQSGVQADETNENKIIRIEDYLKSTINIDENAISEDADNLEKMVKSKVAGKIGFTRLILGIFQKAGIKYQIVFPSKRDALMIDEDFENFDRIDDLLIYFPAEDSYLDPANLGYRYPYADPYAFNTRGLFLKETVIGDFKTSIPSFDSIATIPYEKSFHNIYVDAKFNDSMDSLLLISKQSLAGFGASFYRPIYNFVPLDKQDDFSKDIIKSVGKSDQIKNIRIENSAMTDASKDLPLNIIADIATAELTEKAGNKVLVKVGELIGPQEQLYQDKKRVLPILIQYPHALDRVIKFTIPAGYHIKNPDDLNMSVNDNAHSMGFASSYTVSGSLLTINVHEYYKQLSYPLTKFEEFRKVINASADFNKITLVLEKE